MPKFMPKVPVAHALPVLSMVRYLVLALSRFGLGCDDFMVR